MTGDGESGVVAMTIELVFRGRNKDTHAKTEHHYGKAYTAGCGLYNTELHAKAHLLLSK